MIQCLYSWRKKCAEIQNFHYYFTINKRISFWSRFQYLLMTTQFWIKMQNVLCIKLSTILLSENNTRFSDTRLEKVINHQILTTEKSYISMGQNWVEQRMDYIHTPIFAKRWRGGVRGVWEVAFWKKGTYLQHGSWEDSSVRLALMKVLFVNGHACFVRRVKWKEPGARVRGTRRGRKNNFFWKRHPFQRDYEGNQHNVTSVRRKINYNKFGARLPAYR